VSLAVPSPARYILWAVAALIDAAGPALATLRSNQLPLHIEHLPERFGLFVILVLGEALGGVVRGVHNAHWTGLAVLAGLVGFVGIAALWWIYFDVGADASADDLAETEAAEAEPSEDAVDERHDLFVYGHLPMTFGIVLAGVGLEELALHPDTPSPSAYGWLLAGGAVLFLVGIVIVVGGTAREWRSVWPWPLAALPLLPIVAALSVLNSTSLLAVSAAVLVGIAVTGTLRARGKRHLEARRSG
jgi:low temperature requirement protein LtrA